MDPCKPLSYELVLQWEREINESPTFSKKWLGVSNATIERATAKRRELERLIASRPPVVELDGVRIEVYRRLVKIIQVENGWPNDHFLLEDEIGALTWDLRDDLFAETLIEIEHAFGMPKNILEDERVGY
jgi:hypothetical protein